MSSRSSGGIHFDTLPTIIRLLAFKWDPRGSEITGWPGLGFGGTNTGTILEDVRGSCSTLILIGGPSCSCDCFWPVRGLFPWSNTEAAGWIEGKKCSLWGPWKLQKKSKIIYLWC